MTHETNTTTGTKNGARPQMLLVLGDTNFGVRSDCPARVLDVAVSEGTPRDF